MQANSLLDLPYIVAYDYYHLIDVRSRKSLKISCRQANDTFKNFQKEDAWSEKIAQFILDNYEIINSSKELKDLKKVLQAPYHLILLGEVHTLDAHRLLNAHLIHLIWKEKTLLYVEGNWEKQQNHASLKYLRPDLKNFAKSWDLNVNHPFYQRMEDYFDWTKKMIVQIKEFLILFEDYEALNFNKIFQWIEKNFEESFIKAIEEHIPEIQELKFIEKDKNMTSIHKNINFIYHQFIRILLARTAFHGENYNKYLELHDIARNQSLIEKAHKTFHKKKSGVIIAGSLHIKDAFVLSQIKKHSLLNFIPFLSLCPKTTVNISTINDLLGLFSESLPICNENQHQKVSILTSTLIGNHSTEINSLKNLKKDLLNCNVEEMDASTNHFLLWLALSIKVLIFESQSYGREHGF